MSEITDPEIFRTVLDSLEVGICLLDRDRKVLFWNSGAEKITGHQRHEVVGNHCYQNSLPHCDGRACMGCGATCPFTRTMSDGRPIQLPMELRHHEGHDVPVRARIVPIRNEHGSIATIAASFDERSFTAEDDRRQHTLSAYGCLDDITGIPNQGFTQFHLQESLESFNRYHIPFGVLLVQIREMASFQSKYGREAGDAIARVVAHTLRNTFRPDDFLGRWSHDQFLAILTNSNPTQVQGATERIRRLVGCAELKWWGDVLTVAATVNSAIAQIGDTADSLLARTEDSTNTSSRTIAAVTGGAGS